MRVGRIIFILVLAAIFTLISCQRYAEKGKEERPAPEAGPLWKHINRTEPYTRWKFFPGYEGAYPGQSPHGSYLKLYVNDLAYKAIRNETDMPDGAILVKENYAEDKKTLMAVTPMYKVTGYNPAAGNWFWAEYGPRGALREAGKVESCVECHRMIGGDDFIITGGRFVNRPYE